ncbi:hypothetical protein C0J26_23225 [Pseudomonas baetica]|nr:hypothetical protein C0J26_23225 [Pseudomonas baetica]
MPLREQARSHIGSAPGTDFLPTEDPLWERACSRMQWSLHHRIHEGLNSTGEPPPQPPKPEYPRSSAKRTVHSFAG